jgi:tagatose 1,6-diphosphate aldolase
MELSAGKHWTMRRLAGEDGFFTMTAVDQRPGVEALVASRRGTEKSSYEDVGLIKQVLIEELSPFSSAMLVDPGYAYPFAYRSLDPRKGLIVTAEQWACDEDDGGRRTLLYPDWSVEKIKRMGADGVKLMLWYRPDASKAVIDHQQSLVETLGSECRKHDITFLVEPLVYPFRKEAGSTEYAEDPNKRPEMVIDTVKELKKEKYGIDIFKLETPIAADVIVDPDASGSEGTQAWFDQIDKQLDRPWVMLSAGADKEPFRRILTYAFRAGASGYLAGRAIWWEAAKQFPDIGAFRAKIRSEGVPYTQNIQSMLRAHGRPWPQKLSQAGNVTVKNAGPSFFSSYPAA